MINVVGSDGCGQLAAQSAGTPYLLAVPGKPGAKVKIDLLEVTPAGTAHTATVMRSFGKTTLTSAAATGQAVVNIAADPSGGVAPGPIANTDFVVFRQASSGIFFAAKVSSLATLALTLTANLPYALVAGDTMWWFGAPGDTDPGTGLTHPAYPLAASTKNTISGPVSGAGFIGAKAVSSPVLVHVDNVTAAGVFNRCAWLWTYEPGASGGALLGGILGGGGEEEAESEEGSEGGQSAIFGGGGLGGILKGLPWDKIIKALADLAAKAVSGSGGSTPPTAPPTPTQLPAPDANQGAAAPTGGGKKSRKATGE